MPSNGAYYYAGPPDSSVIGVAVSIFQVIIFCEMKKMDLHSFVCFCFVLFQADNNAEVNMPVLLKNRLLNEETFFLNKSNSKWITIGIVPAYPDLNGKNFSIGIKIGGDNGSLSLNENGLNTVLNLFKSIKYFEKYGSPASIEYERGILISSFPMKGAPCYKIMNQLDNSSICLAMSGVEELMEMEEYLFEIIERIDVAGIEREFENILDKIILDWNDFHENDKSGRLQSQLLINFNDFLMTCVEIRKEAMEREGANDNVNDAANDGNNDDDNGANQEEPPKKKARAPKRKSNQ